MNALLAHLRRRPPGPAADGDLLARYLAAGDEDAFAELVRRHGPVVYAACRRLLPDPADADDAFQAVWLVLVRRAARLAGRPTVGPWLYQVAVWTARNLRRRNAHRIARRAALTDTHPGPSPDAAALRLDLDAALLVLPEKYRAPVVLCHLYGWSRRDAAAHLGCPEGTLSAHLARALARLRKHLAGADPAALLAAAGVVLPAGLASAAVRSAAAFRTASLSAAGVSPAVADLTRGVLRMFWVKKLAAAGLVLAAVVGTGLAVGIGPGPQPQAAAQPPKKADPTADELLTKIRRLEAEVERLRTKQESAARLQPQNPAANAPKEPWLGLVISGGRFGEENLEVHEIGADGKRVGIVHCSNMEILRLVLARTHNDPVGPKTLRVLAPPNYSSDKLAAILDVCKAAGFDKVTVSDTSKYLSPTGGKALRPAYVIEPPDLLSIEVTASDKGRGGLRSLARPVHGEYLIRPDGTVYLGKYGSLKVSGLTIDQATAAVRKHIAGHDSLRGEVAADDLVVALDVKAYNSKRYYVVTQTPEGEQVQSYPLGDGATVLDAAGRITGGRDDRPLRGVWVARRRPDGSDQILPVDWAAVVQRGDATTNYQLQPGDRVYFEPK